MVVINLPVEIAGISSAASICELDAAQEMLDLMVTQRPYVACSLVAYDCLSDTHQTIASIGYDKGALSHLNEWVINNDIVYQYYKAQGPRQRALKWSEMPFAYQEMYSVQKVYWPRGFREGITLRLHSRDGRYTGNLNISTDDAKYPTRAMMTDEIQCLQTILGNFTDLLRSVSRQSLNKTEGGSGCLITRHGDVIEFPGSSPVSRTLLDALISQLKRLDRHQIPEVFMFKHEAAWFRVYTGIVQAGARAIAAQQCKILHGLSERELEIIELLISGATNNEIASRIFVARSTVSKHLEHIFLKLGCNNRTAVVSTALSENLRRLPRLRIPA